MTSVVKTPNEKTERVWKREGAGRWVTQWMHLHADSLEIMTRRKMTKNNPGRETESAEECLKNGESGKHSFRSVSKPDSAACFGGETINQIRLIRFKEKDVSRILKLFWATAHNLPSGWPTRQSYSFPQVGSRFQLPRGSSSYFTPPKREAEGTHE